MRNPTKVK